MVLGNKKIAVGDYALCVYNTSGDGYTVGKVYKVYRVKTSIYDCFAVYDDDGYLWDDVLDSDNKDIGFINMRKNKLFKILIRV